MMILDLHQEILKNSDVPLLNLALEALSRQKCLGSRLSYGDELQLHFGDQQPSRHPKLANVLRGSWILTTRSSCWRAWINQPGIMLSTGQGGDHLRNGQLKVVTQQEMAAAANKLAAIELRTVEVFLPSKADTLNLFLGFTDGSRFELSPDSDNLAEAPEEPDDRVLADWELFTPYKTYFLVGPGPAWSLLRSDKVKTPAAAVSSVSA